MRVTLVIRSLGVGGLERHVVNLAVGLKARGHEPVVLQLYPGTHFVAELESAGISTVTAGVRGRWDLDHFLRKSLFSVRRARPEIVHGFAIEANVLSLAAGLAAGGVPVVWGLGGRNLYRRDRDSLARGAALLHRALASAPALVLVNSHQVRADALRAGFDRASVRVIPNGVDVDRFRHDAAGRRRVREEWGIPDGAALIGIVARLSHAKNHALFLDAASRLSRRREDVRFVCVGDGALRDPLRRLTAEQGLDDRLVWAGERHDMPAVYSALDVATLVSSAEGCPHALCEAMACRVPCVVSDVGDNARVVGDAGVVVDRTADAVTAGWEHALLRGQSFVDAARARIESRYSRDRMVAETEGVLEAVRGVPRRS